MNPTREERSRNRVRIPADVEREDRLIANLTTRQLAILAVAAIALWAIYTSTRRFLPIGVFGVIALPIGAVAIVTALARFEGIAADRWLFAAWRHHAARRRLVPAPDGIVSMPTFLAAQASATPSPLRLPFVDIAEDGTIDLGADGSALICRASAVSFGLRTSGEQEALVSGFARFLNSLAEPVQFLIRAEPIELTAAIERLREAAPGLPHPELERAARAHARFLTELSERRELLRREVLVVLRERTRDDASERLERRANEATTALRAAGVTLVVLDGTAATRVLASALDPWSSSANRSGATGDPVRLANNLTPLGRAG